MSAFLTALGNIGSQYGEAKDEARKDKLAQGQQERRLSAEEAYLQLAKDREAREKQVTDQNLKMGKYLKLGNSYWDVESGKIVSPPKITGTTDSLKDYISKAPKEEQGELTSVAQMETEADPEHPHNAVQAVLTRHNQLKAEADRREDAAARARKADPIITAQIGQAPDPKSYPQGANDPNYRLAAKKWGIEAETIKNRMASQAAEARGKAYGMYRPGAYIDTEGQIHTAFAGEAISKGWTPYAPGFQSMSRTQQIVEMQGASTNLRSAINALQPGDAFDAVSVAQLRAAAASNDPSTFHAIIDNLAASTTNPRQQDYLVWLQQMGERVLSLRNVAGMGQGAQDLRSAIQATLPGITSGSKEYAIKKLDAVDNQVKILGAGIPHTNINKPSIPKVKIGTDGSITIENAPTK